MTHLKQLSHAITTPLLTGLALLSSGSVWAHPGHDELLENSSLMAGLLHPMTGFDHLVMLIGVGFIASQMAQRSHAVRVMVSAIVLLLAGMAMGALSGFATGIEAMILASVGVAAVALYRRQGVASTLLSTLAVSLVLFHGWAHGLEASGNALAGFATGMIGSASLLISTGYLLGRKVSPKWQSAMVAVSGVVLVLAG